MNPLHQAPAIATLLVAMAAASSVRAAEPPPAPEGASSAGKNCFGDPRAKWLLGSTLVGLTNPLGLEVQLQLGRCVPLLRTPGDLFDYTNVQYGLAANLAPVYAMPGAFVSIAPLSVVELRAESEWIGLWPIGLDNAGYFPLAGYDAPWETLPAASAEAATGYTVNFTLNVQVEVPVASGWSVVAVNSASYAFWQVGGASHYYNTRYDLPMARRDWVLRNTALVLASHELSDRVKVRAGVTDDFSWVAGSRYTQNVLGALLTGVIARWPGPESETQPFLRIGGYTAHAFRRGELQLLAGVGMTFDVTPPAAR